MAENSKVNGRPVGIRVWGRNPQKSEDFSDLNRNRAISVRSLPRRSCGLIEMSRRTGDYFSHNPAEAARAKPTWVVVNGG
jgi:hypothetical protein